MESITIKDILLSEKIDSFRNIVFEDKVKALKQYKDEEKGFSKTGIDSAGYNWVIEQVDSFVLKAPNLINFLYPIMALK